MRGPFGVFKRRRYPGRVGAIKKAPWAKGAWTRLPISLRKSRGLWSLEDSPDLEILFSKLELDVLPYLAEGMSNKELGKIFAVELETIKSRISHMLEKSGARNRTHLVAIAYQTGLLSIPSSAQSNDPSITSRQIYEQGLKK
jgi:DNA-binding CsgD family transcriptional regulator